MHQTYHITLTTSPKHRNQLCHPKTSDLILQTFNHHNTNQVWLTTHLLLMPDHLHAITQIPIAQLSKTITNLKRWIARNSSISWNRGYNYRKINDTNDLTTVITYLDQNPVKANLCKSPTHWPHSYQTNASEKLLIPINK